jgi:hypothetical protein
MAGFVWNPGPAAGLDAGERPLNDVVEPGLVTVKEEIVRAVARHRVEGVDQTLYLVGRGLAFHLQVKGDGDNEMSSQFPNGSRIVGLPGSEGTIRGFSAVSLLLVDEASRVPDELYLAVRPMLAVSGCCGR